MQKFKLISAFQGTLIALVPAVAVLIAYLYQVGSYGYLGVPFELVELSTPKIIISIIATVVFFWFYGVIWVEAYTGPHPKKWFKALVWHLFVNAVMTAVFWFRPRAGISSNLIGLAFCLAFFTAGSMWLHHLVRSRAAGKPFYPLTVSAFIAYAFLGVVAVSVISGMDSQWKQTSRLVVKGTSKVFVGTFNGQYVLKEFDPKTGVLTPEGAILVSPSSSVVLERRKLRLKAQD